MNPYPFDRTNDWPEQIIGSHPEKSFGSLREIKHPIPHGSLIEGRSCPSCGGRLYYGQVPCPDGKEGCLVSHYGYNCGNCRKSFT